MTTLPAPSTRNVTRVFREATPDQVAAGLDWYADAYKIAGALAARYDVTLDTAAGILAALSPLNSWGANVNLAARFLDAGGLTSGYLGTGLRAGARILAGGSPLSVLAGKKVNNFFRCIVSAGETDAVCVDRHAFDLAVNTRQTDAVRPNLKGARYDTVADAYRRAARILGVHAAQVQAVTWVSWRQRFWAVGAFDGHADLGLDTLSLGV